jgi:hypothetical protein
MFFLYRPIIKWAARRELVGRNRDVKLAALTISIFQVLLDAGIERAYAIELVSDTTWKVYQQWGRIGQFLARILPKTFSKPAGMEADPKRRIRKEGTFALTFPFNPQAISLTLSPQRVRSGSI